MTCRLLALYFLAHSLFALPQSCKWSASSTSSLADTRCDLHSSSLCGLTADVAIVHRTLPQAALLAKQEINDGLLAVIRMQSGRVRWLAASLAVPCCSLPVRLFSCSPVSHCACLLALCLRCCLYTAGAAADAGHARSGGHRCRQVRASFCVLRPLASALLASWSLTLPASAALLAPHVV